jgi:hypothetical protein
MLISVVGEPLFVDLLVLSRRSFLVMFALVTYCDVVPFTVVRR